MPVINGEYVKQTKPDIKQNINTEILRRQPNANPSAPSTYTFAMVESLSTVIARESEQSLQDLYDAAYIRDATDEELTKKAENLGVTRRPAQRATGVVTFKRSDPATQDYPIPEGTIVETLAEDAVQYETTERVVLSETDTEIDATVRALEGGGDANVGSNAIQAMPSKPAGVETVTNQSAVGDPTLTDTSGDPLVEGRDREADETLRQRVFDTDATSEAPSERGIDKALDDVTGLTSHTLNVNDTASTVDGIDPYTTEVICFGGDVDDIAQTLVDVMSVTTVQRLQGGVNGTKEETTVEADLLDKTLTIPITRPGTVTLDATIDVVHTNAYVGDDDATDAVVEYVGGTLSDGSTTTGLGIGAPILVNEMENIIEDLQGVEYASVTLLDANDDGNDDTTTDADGVPIYDTPSDTVPRIDAQTITLNTTAR